MRKTAEQKLAEVFQEKGLEWLKSQVWTLEILSRPPRIRKIKSLKDIDYSMPLPEKP
jgi:hypothetical protein